MRIGYRMSPLEWSPRTGAWRSTYDVNDQGITAFTLFGIKNLKELIEIHKACPWIIERYRSCS
jgi:hypothetical protein